MRIQVSEAFSTLTSVGHSHSHDCESVKSVVIEFEVVVVTTMTMSMIIVVVRATAVLGLVIGEIKTTVIVRACGQGAYDNEQSEDSEHEQEPWCFLRGRDDVFPCSCP